MHRTKSNTLHSTVFISNVKMDMVITFIVTFLLVIPCFGSGDDTGLVIVETEDNSTVPTIQRPNIIKLDTSFQDEEEYNSEPFIPTKEWQVVKKGQSIPAGLHVRMNFQTHVKEAKLLDGDDGSRFEYLHKKDDEKKTVETKYSRLTNDDAKEVSSGPRILTGEDLQKGEDYKDTDRIYFTKNQLKEALKDFRDKFHDDDLKSEEQEIKRAEAIKKKFRSIEEIRKELEDTVGLSIKSDAQIMKLKVEVLKAANSTESEILNALDDLESYVHQIDNAVDLEKMKGLEVVIQYLNNSNAILQEKAAKVLGSAVQSNPKAQKAALEHGAMPLLFRLMSYSSQERLRKTALFALSALIRTHSGAQITFLKLDGLKKVLQILEKKNSLALKIKAVTLVSDLIVEQEDVRLRMIENGKLSKRKRTPLMTALISDGWCEILPSQLDHSVSNKDSEEKVLSAIMASTSSCKESFKKNNLKKKLNKLEQKYNKEIKNEDDVDYKSYLESFPDQIGKILEKLDSDVPVLI